jgi:hypothetical protein
MKTILPFLVFFILFCNGYSQITLTINNTPLPAHKYYYKKVALNNVNVNTSGANIIWDFSNIIVQQDSLIKYYSIDNTFSETLLRSGSLYYRITSSIFSLAYMPVIGYNTGYGSPSTIYNGNVNITKFLIPFSFNDSINQNWQSYDESGTNFVKADAYGTLILPDTTYENTLRLHTYLVDVQTPYTNHIYSCSYEYQIFEWYTENSQVPIFSVTYTDKFCSDYMTEDHFPTVTSAYVFEKNVNSNAIQQSNFIDNNLVVYPNPTNDFININFNANKSGYYNFEIYDLIGTIQINEGKYYIHSGHNSLKFNIGNLKKGVYIIKYNSDFDIGNTEKIVIY